MATIEKRTTNSATSYRAKVRLKGYPTQSATFARLTDAKKWVQDTESAIREGRHFKTSESKKHTVKDLVERYIKEILPQKPKSTIDQKTQLGWWKSGMGSFSLADVTPALITEYRSKLALEKSERKGAKRSNATVNRYCSVLSHAFTIAVKEWGWMQENPMMKIKKLKEPRGRVRFLNDEERERLLEACQESSSPFLYILVVLGISTGARKMEIRSLEWKDVDLNRGMIILHDTKNGERRSLPLVGIAKDLMKAHYKNRNKNTELVFPAKNLQTPIDIRTPFETALQKAEIEDFKWHDLRHSCASYLAMNGATLAEIAGVLGHKTLSMVKRYSHISDAHTAGVVARMNNKIFGGRNE
jgi:integrase